MNLSNLVISVLVGVFAVFAAPENGVSQVAGKDINHLDWIIEQGDQPANLIEWFRERRLEYSLIAHHFLLQMVAYSRPKLFKAFFDYFEFEHGGVDGRLSWLLMAAFCNGNTDIGEFLLSHKFQFNHELRSNWCLQYRRVRDWDLEDFMKLLLDYPDIAASICPSPDQKYEQYGAYELLLLIKLAHFCATVSQKSHNPVIFDTSTWMQVVKRTRFSKAVKNQIEKAISVLSANVDRIAGDNSRRRGPRGPFLTYLFHNVDLRLFSILPQNPFL
jgi:hypothetical protein